MVRPVPHTRHSPIINPAHGASPDSGSPAYGGSAPAPETLAPSEKGALLPQSALLSRRLIPTQPATDQKANLPAAQLPTPQNEAPSRQGVGQIPAPGRMECLTCKNRKYQDQSNDSGVSYQTPTKISPGQAASAVRAHEYEHVSREQSKADQQGRDVVSQSVVIRTAICPECGRVYVSGGTTTTLTRDADNDAAPRPEQAEAPNGRYLSRNV